MQNETCPQDEQFRNWLRGSVPVEDAEALSAHLEACPDCQAKLSTISDIDDTLIDYLRQPPLHDEFQDEPELQQAVTRAKAIGDTLLARHKTEGGGGAQPGHHWPTG